MRHLTCGSSRSCFIASAWFVHCAYKDSQSLLKAAIAWSKVKVKGSITDKRMSHVPWKRHLWKTKMVWTRPCDEITDAMCTWHPEHPERNRECIKWKEFLLSPLPTWALHCLIVQNAFIWKGTAKPTQSSFLLELFLHFLLPYLLHVKQMFLDVFPISPYFTLLH
jgi:hypothetical protein